MVDEIQCVLHLMLLPCFAPLTHECTDRSPRDLLSLCALRRLELGIEVGRGDEPKYNAIDTAVATIRILPEISSLEYVEPRFWAGEDTLRLDGRRSRLTELKNALAEDRRHVEELEKVLTHAVENCTGARQALLHRC